MPHAPVYLDNHATTPVDPRVVEAMLPYFTDIFGNPASTGHQWGWRAQEAVEQARREIAVLIGGTAHEIVFTSGATESNNLAMCGITDLCDRRRHLVVSAIEHKSVLARVRPLEASGWRVSIVPVDRDGIIDLDALRGVLCDETALVSVMAANNEIGVIQPLAEIGALVRACGGVFHVDGAQGVGKIPIDVNAMQIDLLSVTGHKMYGPKGCGALYIRKRLELSPMIYGGGQERGLRSGTLNVPGIVGLGRACALCGDEMPTEQVRLAALRDRLLHGLQETIGGVTVNGSLTHRLPNNLHVSFEGVDSESLLIGVGDIAVSSGSACSSASAEPSHVLRAISGGRAVPSATIRFGLGRFTTADEIEYAVEKFSTVVRHLRDLTLSR
jgi:cysteine desulfurase